MKVWITKYALTEGIVEREAKVINTRYTMIELQDNTFTVAYYHKPDWHASREEAVERAEQMRARKIAALKEQLAKLEAMKF